MKYKAASNLILSQVAFLLTIAICYFLWPASQGSIHALSDYGTKLPTAIPYVIGFIISVSFMFKAARALPDNNDLDRKLSKIFNLLGVLVLILLITPYTLHLILFAIHMTTGMILYTGELILAAWLVWKAHWNAVNIILLTIQFSGGILLFFALDQIGYLPSSYVVYGQIVAISAFAVLMVRTVM